MNKRKLWTQQEINILTELWDAGESKEIFTKHLPNRTYVSIQQKAERIGLVHPILWSDSEIEKLIKYWCGNFTDEEISENFKNRQFSSIETMARRMRLKRHKTIRDNSRKKSNAKYRRDLSLENLREIASKYKTKNQFSKEDNSAYVHASKRKLLDDICGHMIPNIKFNYAQTALFEIIKIIFQDDEVLYNDRTAIKPKELDVYIPSFKIAFEYDGKRHHTTPEGIVKDEIKNNLCKDNNIKLYRILEENIKNPIPSILDQLSKFGFDVNSIHIDIVISKIINKYVDLNNIAETVLNYSSIIELKTKNHPLYSFIYKNKLNHLVDCIRKYKPKKEF